MSLEVDFDIKNLPLAVCILSHVCGREVRSQLPDSTFMAAAMSLRYDGLSSLWKSKYK